MSFLPFFSFTISSLSQRWTSSLYAFRSLLFLCNFFLVPAMDFLLVCPSFTSLLSQFLPSFFAVLHVPASIRYSLPSLPSHFRLCITPLPSQCFLSSSTVLSFLYFTSLLQFSTRVLSFLSCKSKNLHFTSLPSITSFLHCLYLPGPVLRR